jgi:hypothetical protein
LIFAFVSIKERQVLDWNVVVTVFQGGYRRAVRFLCELGPVERTPYHNVLLMKAGEPMALLQAIEGLTRERPALYDAISRVAPAQRAFDFQGADEFLATASVIVREWSPQLEGRGCHVRLHLRGLHHALTTQEMERRLDGVILDVTTAAGHPARIVFDDCAAVISIDVIDGRAGIGLWRREDLARYRVLRPD